MYQMRQKTELKSANFTCTEKSTYLCLIGYEEFEDTKGAIRIRISKKNTQHNGQKKKYKRTNNDLQNIHIKLKIKQQSLTHCNRYNSVNMLYIYILYLMCLLQLLSC